MTTSARIKPRPLKDACTEAGAGDRPAWPTATFVDVGSAETLRDEAIEYATRLAQAGVPVDLHVWAGGYHGFDQMVPDAAISRAATAARRSFLERALRK